MQRDTVPIPGAIGVDSFLACATSWEVFFIKALALPATARGPAPLTGDLYADYIRTDLKGGDAVKLSAQIRPISYLKAHAAEIVRNIGKRQEPLVITQNGEAKAVVQDIHSYEQAQETMALLKILALGNRQIEEGKVESAASAVRRLRQVRQAR